MDEVWIEGGRKLKGTVQVSGSKNATLPILTATLLAPGIYRFTNVPALRDVSTMLELLSLFGIKSRREDSRSLFVDSTGVHNAEAPYDLVRTMRASIYVLGPLLARFGEARVSLPGGCAWGPRPVDLHIRGMQRLGADVEIEHGYIVARCNRLQGSVISFEISSVGATGNILMAAATAEGETVIENAACEPEIEALARFLATMGARIEGMGTSRLVITGRNGLYPADAPMIPDRIEAGTFLTAAAITGGEVEATCVEPRHLDSTIAKLEEAGASVEVGETSVRVRAPERVRPITVTTAPYPGFPTDMQAQFMALLSVADGTSTIVDTVYQDRFTHVAELQRLGADIRVEGNTAVVHGLASLSGAPVMATDLRASAALILAGLVAKGETRVSRVYHLDRGYERIEEKLQGLGAAIRRVRA
ncbi:MAG: UDP-N-acetylglucosamine 1-carboxyvinyltransferase [Candidatus Eisenbacteria bacterium]|uniref:UDP-N-acetylglucosamine 1-carboxyvinyltransferase n=1 Tax=Eiseniibacteriota bacterium TaxID=2212470 RepID=A0A538T3Z0_UNCEI|nr:MAG: UDP-N-acetylglucosamine 1-carboxyvinyltransferase [Candidatus Eisenbacteria bacterium]